jgi:hypothetical protein
MVSKPLFFIHNKTKSLYDSPFRNIYREAQNCRELRMLDCHRGDPDKQLSAIVDEIKIRI